MNKTNEQIDLQEILRKEYQEKFDVIEKKLSASKKDIKKYKKLLERYSIFDSENDRKYN